jgi:hypothetical protein
MLQTISPAIAWAWSCKSDSGKALFAGIALSDVFVSGSG